MLLNNEWINNEEIKKYLETNENEHTITHSIAIQTYLKKLETFQINNLTVHL